MKTKIILFFSIVVSSVHCIFTEKATIRAVALLTRHGDRSPTGTFPNNPLPNSTWPCGFGALTSTGVRMLYKSGFSKANRYDMLGATNGFCFRPENIYARSSGVRRCLISAQSFLDGLTNDEKLKQIKIVFPNNVVEDGMLSDPGRPCNMYEESYWYAQRLDQPAVMNITGGNDFIQYVETNSGMAIRNLEDFFTITDCLNIELIYGYQIPEWADSIYESKLKPLYELYFAQLYPTKKFQIKSGYLLNDMIVRLENYNTGEKQNIMFYSAHDTTLNGLMYILDVIDQAPSILPNYGAVFAIEIHFNIFVKSQLEVKLFYFKFYNAEDPIEMKIPTCRSPCSFEDFKSIINARRVNNYDNACNNNNNV